jgi:hypothetical protein
MTQQETSYHFWGDPYTLLGPPCLVLAWFGRPTSGGRDLVYGGMRRRGSVRLNGKHRTTSGGILTVHWVLPDWTSCGLVVHDAGVEL